MKYNNCRFPDPEKKPELHAIWVENVNRDAAVKFIPTKGSRLCSEHFSANVLQMTEQKVTLLPDAVPTIFQKSQVCTPKVMK